MGKVKLKRVALDSNVFIYHFEENKEFITFTRKIFYSLSLNNLKAITSVVSIIETLSFSSPQKVINEIKQAFFTLPNLEIFDVDQAISLEAARIRRKYKFRLPDSIQLATAKLNKAKVFISNDKRLKQFKELKVTLLKEVYV